MGSWVPLCAKAYLNSWQEACGWDSVLKLETLYRKCANSQGKQDTGDGLTRMEWILKASYCLLLEDRMQRTMFSVRNWSGKGCTGGKGTCDLLLFKYAVTAYVMEFVESASVEAKEKSKMREIFKDYETCEQAYGRPGEIDHDMTWLGGFSETARLCCSLIQARAARVEIVACFKSYS